MRKLESFKIEVLGDPDQISFERYFISLISLVTSIFLVGLCLFHVTMGLKLAPVILAGSSSLIMMGVYYFVRFRNILYFPKVILTGLGLIILDFTWYSKFLSNGPVLFFILIFAALLIWVWEGKCLAVLLAFYFLNLAVLFYIDSHAPEYLFKYPDPKTRSLDIFLSFFLYSILLISLLYAIKKEFLRQKEKAIKSDELKSAFLANMSHEIRTPMNGILGFSALLRTPGLKGDTQQEYIDIIEKSGQRMLNIINDIIDISKIESGLMNIQTKDTNVKAVIEYIYTFFKPEVEGKGIQFSFTNNLPSNKANIITDKEKLYSILTNLVKNAIKYTDKGSIQIGCDLIKYKDASSLRFFVKDTGIGIAKNKQVEIFERFIQADISYKMVRQGAGLGLSITKAFIEMLGGKIWVESEEGKGSIFYFTLPYDAELIKIVANKSTAALVEDVTLLPKLKILIAEDDETSNLLLQIGVRIFGKEILTAKTGVEAVEICRNIHDIDLVLMDIQLPDLNGYEATQQIRQFNKKVIIIAQTAYGLSGDREKALVAGCNDYISKPVEINGLRTMIQVYFK